MNLKTFVKVGNITNLSDARYCAGMGVDMLGFCVNPASPDFIHPDNIKEIIGWVAGPQFVADYGNLEINDIKQIQEGLELETIQVSNVAAANQLAAEGQSVLLKLEVSSDHDLNKLNANFDSEIKYLHISSDTPSLYDQIDQFISNSSIDIPILKGYNLSSDSISTILEDSPFSGIVLKGSHEEKPGYKDYEELADILEALEEE